MPNDYDDDVSAISDWLATLEKKVDAVDYAGARHLFHDDVVSFGTHMDIVTGLDAFEHLQWQSVWPTIDDFKLSQNSLKAFVSPDRCHASAILTWTSTGYHQDGKSFARNGRATIVLTRKSVDAPWQGSHTHLSLNADTPRKSYGNKPARTSA